VENSHGFAGDLAGLIAPPFPVPQAGLELAGCGCSDTSRRFVVHGSSVTIMPPATLATLAEGPMAEAGKCTM
jgi:hypothetical protein